MKKGSSIKRTKIKFAIVGFLLALGLVLTFVTIPFGVTNLKSFASTIKLGLDLKGGVYAVYEMQESDNTENLASRMDGTRQRLQDMLVDKGYAEATVVKEGETRLRVEVPDVADPGKIFDLIGKPASLEFIDDDGNTVITGEHVLSANAGFDNQSQGYVVYLSLNSDGARRFSDATAPEKNGQSIEIRTIVPGEEPKTISKPTINTQITNGNAIITGMESQEAAQSLADQITSGQFEVKLALLNTSTVTATLGENALTRGLIAGIIGVLLIMVFMCFFYRLNGVMSSIALLCYTVLFLFFLAALPWVQLTLPGIAGILLSIGMEIDGNVIMFERIKNEFRNGKSIKAASYSGMKKSFATIFDANITTIIASVVLLIFGTGPIKSFALTLLVGVALAMFTNLVVINAFTKWSLVLNQSNEKLYGLNRGPAFKNLPADKTDVTIAESEEQLTKEKEKAKVKKERRAATEGGVV